MCMDTLWQLRTINAYSVGMKPPSFKSWKSFFIFCLHLDRGYYTRKVLETAHVISNL